MNRSKRIAKNRYRNSLDEYGFHSWSYQKHFEGYEERKQGRRIIREYKGCFYRRSVNKKQGIILKMVYGVLYLAAVVMYLAAGMAPYTADYDQWYIFLPEAADLLILVYLLKTIVFYVTAPSKLTIGEYKEDCKRLIVIAFTGSVCFLLTACGYFGSSCMSRQWYGSNRAGWMVIGAICLTAMGVIEKKIKYETKTEKQMLLEGDCQNGV